MTSLAERLTRANREYEKMEEEVSRLFSTLGIWDDIEEWDYQHESYSLWLHLRRGAEPDFSQKIKAGLKAAGFEVVHFPDWGPLATIEL